MTHFKELVETITMTTGLSKREIQEHLKVSVNTFSMWQRQGPPINKLPIIMHRLKGIIHTQKKKSIPLYWSLRHQGMFDYQIAERWGIQPNSLYQWKRRVGA